MKRLGNRKQVVSEREWTVGPWWLLGFGIVLSVLLISAWFVGHRDTHRVGDPRLDTPAFQLEDTECVSVLEREPDVIYRQSNLAEGKKQIALTFDDGPHPQYTPQILEILKEYDVKATFFMIGENVHYYHDVAEAVRAAGHEIGNHTYSHARLDQLSREDVLEQISSCEDEIASLQEYRPKFFRPPEGHLSDLVRRVSGDCDYRLVMWDVDTRDWAHTPPETICQKVLETVAPGDIILMHDFIGHNSPTPDALRLVIPALLERGFELVTVGELLNGE